MFNAIATGHLSDDPFAEIVDAFTIQSSYPTMTRAEMLKLFQLFVYIPIIPIIIQFAIRILNNAASGWTAHIPSAIATTCLSVFIAALIPSERERTSVTKPVVLCFLTTITLYFVITFETSRNPQEIHKDLTIAILVLSCVLFAVFGVAVSMANNRIEAVSSESEDAL